jgi:hypothetical protein
VGHATGARVIGAYDFMAHYLYQGILEGAYEAVPNIEIRIEGAEG